MPRLFRVGRRGTRHLYENGVFLAVFYYPLLVECIKPQSEDEIFVTDIGLFKGLESDMVIYIHKDNISSNLNYIALHIQEQNII